MKIAGAIDGALGAPETIAKGVPGDDLAVDPNGALSVTTHPYNTVVRITPDGTRSVIADAGSGATGATAIAFGRDPADILSNRHFPRHAHDQYCVGVMLDGGHVSWSGCGQVEAGPNQVITLSPNEIHDGKSLRGIPRRWPTLFVDPHIIAEFAGAEMAAREFPLLVIANLDLARHTAAALHELPNSNIEEASEIIVDLFATLLVSPGNIQRPSVLSRSIQRMVECLHDNFCCATLNLTGQRHRW